MSNNDHKISPVNVDINVDATELVNESLTKPLGTVTDTFNAAWGLTLGWIDYFYEKSQISRAANLAKYKELTQSCISSIPIDHLQEPKMSILGPSIKSSEFYFEEEHYREMFSKLIAGSFNSEYNEIIHPSFSTVITELSRNDARTLQYYYNLRETSKSMYLRKIVITKFGQLDKKYSIFPGLLISSRAIDSMSREEISMSISNLERLNLIMVHDPEVKDPTSDDYFNNLEVIKSFKKENQNTDFILKPKKVTLTTYGKNFSFLCLKTSDQHWNKHI